MSEENGPRWSPETDRVLRGAGWYPGRSVPTDDWESALHERGGFEMHGSARRFLAEFGGLESNERGPGRTMARMGFRLDPTVAEWDDEVFDVLSEGAGVDLYPIGNPTVATATWASLRAVRSISAWTASRSLRRPRTGHWRNWSRESSRRGLRRPGVHWWAGLAVHGEAQPGPAWGLEGCPG
ncbi:MULTISPECIES: SUKH-3 domain-containing protein [unclassified Streptomyces]|uniref:SUKH-3 domain-containing protein n=1 Tax=unclassified Streptomyces TaxID=2593676 RepID=UPI0033902C9B